MFERLISVLAVLLLAGCFSINKDLSVGDGEIHEGSLRTVNGSIRVGSATEVTGGLRTVNGSITVGSESKFDSAETINGKIQLGAGTVSGSIESVNGNLEIGGKAVIDGDVETVNGRALIGPEAIVQGRVRTVNGQIRIQGATVESVLNVRGGIVLEAGSEVLGKLIVEEGGSDDSNEPVLVEIHADCKVGGPLIFERPVQLRVHESATIGDVEGAEPEIFSD